MMPPEFSTDTTVRMILQMLPDCLSIYRFGSWGGTAERHDSDLDIAIMPAQRLQSRSTFRGNCNKLSDSYR